MKLNTFTRVAGTLSLSAAALAMTGCATVTTLAEHGSLDVSTKMSQSVFLNPVAPAQKTVYVQVHNTTDKGSIGLAQALDAAIQQKGWTLDADPSTAEIVLQVNVLQAGQIKQDALNSAFMGGYGGPLGSAVLGGGVAALSGGGGVAVGGAALGLGVADFVGGLLVKNVTISVITDVRVMQRGAAGQTFTTTHTTGIGGGSNGSQSTGQVTAASIIGALMGQGTQVHQSSGSTVQSDTQQSYTTQSPYMIHQTRVVSYANKVNLKWADAEPALRTGLVNNISGLF